MAHGVVIWPAAHIPGGPTKRHVFFANKLVKFQVMTKITTGQDSQHKRYVIF